MTCELLKLQSEFVIFHKTKSQHFHCQRMKKKDTNHSASPSFLQPIPKIQYHLSKGKNTGHYSRWSTYLIFNILPQVLYCYSNVLHVLPDRLKLEKNILSTCSDLSHSTTWKDTIHNSRWILCTRCRCQIRASSCFLASKAFFRFMCLWYRIQALQNNINNIAINNEFKKSRLKQASNLVIKIKPLKGFERILTHSHYAYCIWTCSLVYMHLFVQ